MNILSKIALGCTLAVASTAFAAAEELAPCAKDPRANGLPQRMARMQEQMDRI